MQLDPSSKSISQLADDLVDVDQQLKAKVAEFKTDDSEKKNLIHGMKDIACNAQKILGELHPRLNCRNGSVTRIDGVSYQGLRTSINVMTNLIFKWQKDLERNNPLRIGMTADEIMRDLRAQTKDLMHEE